MEADAIDGEEEERDEDFLAQMSSSRRRLVLMAASDGLAVSDLAVYITTEHDIIQGV